MVEVEQFVDNVEVKSDDNVIPIQKIEDNATFSNPHFDQPTIELSSNRLKQIIYVYEDHTFEVYDVRK